MNDLVDFFKKQSKKAERKKNRGPGKLACMTKGPAVTICTYYIQRTIPLVILGGSPRNVKGPAVTNANPLANDNKSKP
jgi:hypothetical protein